MTEIEYDPSIPENMVYGIRTDYWEHQSFTLGPEMFETLREKAALNKRILALVALNLADIVTTTLALHNGAHEGNPLMKPVAGSILLLVLVKCLVIGGLVAALKAQPSPRRALLRAQFAVGVYSMVVLSNLLVISHA